MNYEPRNCVICGKEYIPKRKDQKSCGDPGCVKETTRLAQKAYREKNYEKVLKGNRERARRRNEEKLNPTKKDTLIAIGYAERQRAATLELVGKIKVEL